MIKLFISYRSLNSSKITPIVEQLQQQKHAPDMALYHIWQDKISIPPGQDWWEAIVDGVIACEFFVFMVSSDSVKNDNCRAELSYARKRNRPIIPIVLEGEFITNPVSGKNDIGYWQDIPDELNDMRVQFLFYQADTFLEDFQKAIQHFQSEPESWKDLDCPRPPDPRHANDLTNNSAAIFDEACEYAHKLDFDTAERRFQRLLNSNDLHFATDAEEWIKILREYKTIVEFDYKESTRYQAAPLWQVYRQKFPKPFIALFDPKDFDTKYGNMPLPPKEKKKIEQNSVVAAMLALLGVIAALIVIILGVTSLGPPITPTPTPPEPVRFVISSENCQQDLTAIFAAVEQELAAAAIYQHPNGTSIHVRCATANNQFTIEFPEIQERLKEDTYGNFSVVWIASGPTWVILAEPLNILITLDNDIKL